MILMATLINQFKKNHKTKFTLHAVVSRRALECGTLTALQLKQVFDLFACKMTGDRSPGRVDLLHSVLCYWNCNQTSAEIVLRFIALPTGSFTRQIQLLWQRHHYQQYGKIFGFSPVIHLENIPYSLEYAAVMRHCSLYEVLIYKTFRKLALPSPSDKWFSWYWYVRELSQQQGRKPKVREY
jgi:hypothetical protein